jgi:signal transduction histidine kinase
MDFGADPENQARIIEPSGSTHEIGVAEDALAMMQRALVHELAQKKHLAALGLAVAKINHDLRNMLASAQLLSDRLAELSDPVGRRLAPKLVATLDRAIIFCQSTLTYGRAVERPPKFASVPLRGLVVDVLDSLTPDEASGIELVNEVPEGMELRADTEQMFRVMLNLCRNAIDALESAGAQPGRQAVVRVTARREPAHAIIEVADSGPGVPERARANIFEAFQGSARPGGTGLGLAIAADLVRVHGGQIALIDAEGPQSLGGATFRIMLPVRARRRNAAIARRPRDVSVGE